MYSFHARNRILFGDPNPFNDNRWIVFEYSLVSFVSYAWFSLTGITLAEANTVGVLLSIGGLLLLLLGLIPHHRPWVTTAVALTYLLNVSLLTYGRLPYMENGLLFLSGAIFLVWSRWGRTGSGQIVLGLLLGLTVILGKAYGILLLPATGAAIVITFRGKSMRPILRLLAAFGVGTGALVWGAYRAHIGDAIGFFHNQSLGTHGFPEGLKSPWAFVEHLVSFGADSNLFYLNPDLLVLLLAGGALAAMLVGRRRWSWQQLPPTTVLAICWTGFVWVGLTPLNYSPLRYSLLLIPAIIVLPYSIIDWLMKERRELMISWASGGKVILSLLLATTIFEVLAKTVYFNKFSAPFHALAGGSLGAGVFLAWMFGSVGRRRMRLTGKKVMFSLVTVLILSTVVVNTFRIRRKHFLDTHFSTIEANQDLTQIVGKQAVIAGPYGPTLTFQTGHRSLIRFFDGTSVDSTLFSKFPITHLAVDISNWRKAVRLLPELAQLRPIATYWIRDIQVQIYRVAEISKNPLARQYSLSPYEQAVAYYGRNQIDSAFFALGVTPDIINTSKAAGILFSELLEKQKQYQHVLAMLSTLADRYPTDFSLQLECGHFLQKLALRQNNPTLLQKAENYFQKAIQLNPYRAAYANNLFAETMKQRAVRIGNPPATETE